MSERDTPLFFHWNHRPHFDAMRREFDCNESGAAILLSLHAANGPVSYSRNKNYYNTPRRYRDGLFTYAKITGEVDRLAASFTIEHHRMPKANFGRQSWMKLTDDARQKIEQLVGDKISARPPVETIILRDKEKALCEYRDSVATRAMRRKTIDINEALMSCRLIGCFACPLYRIFNRTFERGGRFYSAGGWQSLPKTDRAKIKIDGQEVVEIDFKSMHPCLTYTQFGLPTPGECYEISPWPRGLVKVSFLILLNAETPNSAHHAIAQHEVMASVAVPGSREAYQKARQLVDDIKSRHTSIADAFHSDQGAKLMRIDSEIAQSVMTKLNKRGLVALPVHDSFLIGRSHAKNLEEVMHEAACEAGFADLETEIQD